MGIIIANSLGQEIRFWDIESELDLEVGGDNDFEFKIPLELWDEVGLDYGYRIFIPNTEYGGIIQDIESNTKTGKVVIRGEIWRGMLSKKIIMPINDSFVVRGELNTILNQLVSPCLEGLFFVSSENTQVMIEELELTAFATLLEGIEAILSSVKYKLSIRYIQGNPGKVELKAVPIENYSETIEYSQDSKINFVSRDYRRGINHLICVSEKEGTDRIIIHLYVQEDGTIGSKPFYTGVNEREAVYTCSTTEESKILEDGEKKLRELMNYKSFEISIDDVDLEIGDIVGGRDRYTGILVQKPIVRKILKIKEGTEEIEYQLKGED